jgi:hypothetical protein
MDTIDLEINNYSLEDILNLFRLEYDFNENDLKNAKLSALKSHPDKSGLDKKYFLFFRKAYNLVNQIYKYKNKKFSNVGNIKYKDLDMVMSDDVSKKKLLKKALDGKSVDEFNEWFNKIFTEVKLRDEDNDDGYGDWMNSNDDIEDINVSNKNEFEARFNKKKQEARMKALVVKRDIVSLNNTTCDYELSRKRPEKYSSGIFSKLGYEDLKVAHTETVIPVTNEDYLNYKKFGNTEELKKHRRETIQEPISLTQSKKLLSERNATNNMGNVNRVFELLKRDEEIEDANKKIWANMRLLNN